MTRILVADPDEAMRIFLSEELQEEGYDVLEAAAYALITPLPCSPLKEQG